MERKRLHSTVLSVVSFSSYHYQHIDASEAFKQRFIAFLFIVYLLPYLVYPLVTFSNTA